MTYTKVFLLLYNVVMDSHRLKTLTTKVEISKIFLDFNLSKNFNHSLVSKTSRFTNSLLQTGILLIDLLGVTQVLRTKCLVTLKNKINVMNLLGSVKL